MQRDRKFKTYKNRGCPLYDLLVKVYSGSSATGQFGNASTAPPATSSEERHIERQYREGEESVDRGKRPLVDSDDSSPALKRKKKVKSKDNAEKMMERWSQSLDARTTRDEAITKNYENSTAESSKKRNERPEATIEQVVEAVEALGDIPAEAFNRASFHFWKYTARRFFLSLNTTRRRQWLLGLKD